MAQLRFSLFAFPLNPFSIPLNLPASHLAPRFSTPKSIDRRRSKQQNKKANWLQMKKLIAMAIPFPRSVASYHHYVFVDFLSVVLLIYDHFCLAAKAKCKINLITLLSVLSYLSHITARDFSSQTIE